MARRTLADLLNPNTCRMFAWLGIDPTDSRLVTWANSASNILLHKGRFVGTEEKYTVQTVGQILTLPPLLDAAEKIALGHHPMTLRSPWFEFLDSGWGVTDDPTSARPVAFNSQALQRGFACTFQDITAPGGQLILQCDVASDIGKQVLLLGLDTQGNWIRTETTPGSGIWQNGYLATLSQTPGTTTSAVNGFARLTGIQIPAMAGQWWLYQVGNPVPIGHYQFWESNPSYRRYLLPHFGPSSVQVDIMGKAAFRPVANPTDYLMFNNLEAIMYACAAVKAIEERRTEDAALLMNGKRDSKGQILVDGALTLMDSELQHFQGGVLPVPALVGSGHPPVPTWE